MKPFDELTPRQKFFRQNIVRLIIYGGFVAGLFWNITRMVEIEEEMEAERQAAQVRYHCIEETMMNYYALTPERSDTVGMGAHMKQHLTPEDYLVWLHDWKQLNI